MPFPLARALTVLAAPALLGAPLAASTAAASAAPAPTTTSATAPSATAAVAATATTTPGPVVVARTVAAFAPVRDSQGNLWQARTGLVGGSSVSARLAGKPVAGTTEDALYGVSTFTSTGYTRAVTNGTYRVRLLMAEGYWSAPGQRVFHVRAENQPALTGVDIIKEAGVGTALDRTFSVQVTDGTLNLDFVKVVDNPLIAGIEVSTAPPVAPVTTNTLIPLTNASAFRDDISRAPLASNSAAIAANVTGQVRDHYGSAAFNAHAWGVTFYKANVDTPKVRVNWTNCLGYGYTPPDFYGGTRIFADVPIPTHAVPSPGTDAALSIYDPTSDTLWEFWQANKSATGSWSACSGGKLVGASKVPGQFPTGYGVSASGLAMTPGVISAAEAAAGQIDHAMYLGVPQARAVEFSWPATRTDGVTTDSSTPMEGQRLRLDPSLDVNTLQVSPLTKAIARAAQKHGFIVMDKGGAVALVGEGGQSLKATTGTDPWPTLIGGPDYEAMRGFPWHRIQALPKDYGKR